MTRITGWPVVSQRLPHKRLEPSVRAKLSEFMLQAGMTVKWGKTAAGDDVLQRAPAASLTAAEQALERFREWQDPFCCPKSCSSTLDIIVGSGPNVTRLRRKFFRRAIRKIETKRPGPETIAEWGIFRERGRIVCDPWSRPLGRLP
jgi:hypothetical protein